jgi:hypothetical protein
MARAREARLCVMALVIGPLHGAGTWPVDFLPHIKKGDEGHGHHLRVTDQPLRCRCLSTTVLQIDLRFWFLDTKRFMASDAISGCSVCRDYSSKYVGGSKEDYNTLTFPCEAPESSPRCDTLPLYKHRVRDPSKKCLFLRSLRGESLKHFPPGARSDRAPPD